MERNSAAAAIHYLVRAVLLAGFAFYIVYLVRTGSLNLYIAERMQLIVKLSALGLYVVAAQQFYLAIRSWFNRSTNAASCDCNHEMPSTWARSLLLYGWFALPLVLGFTLPDGLLGSSMASAKGVQFAPQQIVKPFAAPPADTLVSEPEETEAALDSNRGQLDNDSSESTAEASTPTSETRDYEEDALDLLFPADSFTESYAKFGRTLVKQELVKVEEKQFIETLTTIDLFRTAFIGKTIQISGFVYRENTMGAQQFGVSRFAINCCSADASPYGVMVKFGRANTLETDEWVTVTGKLETTMYNDIEIIQINVNKVVKITPPDEPYVSPDLDFGLE
ncbi:TIGR03943 family protein [Cohnella sp.]|uniref:TIGR03943 family putative permease subunit n=1 Tax=Cohnella sp. TaxID=1883426 RepID=UPI0035694C2D